MADSSRSKPVTPRVALPKIPPWKAPVPPADITKAPQQQTARSDGKARQPVDLTAHIGARVQITNTLSRTLVGTIYSCDPDLVLSTGPSDYHIIPLSKISRYEVLSRDESPPKRAMDEAAEKEKERQAKLKEERLIKPPGVSSIGHRLFLMLDKTLPVRWHNKSIVVLDNVLIEPPYGVEDCKAPTKHAKQLERVKELVRNEQEKLQKENTLSWRGG